MSFKNGVREKWLAISRDAVYIGIDVGRWLGCWNNPVQIILGVMEMGHKHPGRKGTYRGFTVPVWSYRIEWH